MSAQLAISVDNTTQTLTSGVASDILDLYLAETNASTTQNITIQLVRNCCADGAVEVVLAPRYVFSLTNIYDATYIPPGLSANDRLAKFTLVGIDESFIQTYEVNTNEDDPDGNTFAWKEYTASEAFTTGFGIYYLDGGPVSTVKQIRITTIDGYVYLLDVTYTWGTGAPPTATTTSIAIASQPAIPDNVTVDFIGNTIDFNTTIWGLNTTDNVFLDGVYNYSLTETNVGADRIELVSKFFNVQLRCLVTTYLSNNLTDTTVAALMHALELADDCNLSTKQKCALYNQIIRKLLLANQVVSINGLGSNCGCS